MRHINSSTLSPEECIGIQINGLSHCKTIHCKWQNLSACQGLNIIMTGRNSKGFLIGPDGLAEESTVQKIEKNK
ncbi:MAG: hypothetical protein A2W93_11945 [Bacteroidetes bacterium GWF2_43_63]|nr:MAG: hypothetical protein A2W94_00480 [Bacteroidetes bacterium GWE2_42_42]OFY55454.1 MAG: hypothetical protein A2W93_11945 [Bacteroidetes bacterium GWF2_43_63]HBG70310.1 hypothetical protein [Bacteroidales bacterium]HCB60305.1 hypothetical protein [Bacteroidales bacterium]HCY23583.1 hypothetical protein [Bacteroidales bacterium]